MGEILEEIQRKLKRFKSGPAFIFIVVLAAAIMLWNVWFTVQPEETLSCSALEK
jgi:uncharacterized membrane protein